MAAALSGHVPAGYAVQSRVDQRRELFKRKLITFVPRDEQPGDLVG